MITNEMKLNKWNWNKQTELEFKKWEQKYIS